MDLLEGLGDLQAKAKKGGGEARQEALKEVESPVLVAPLLVGKAWRRRYKAGRQFGLNFIQQRDQNYVEGVQ